MLHALAWIALACLAALPLVLSHAVAYTRGHANGARWQQQALAKVRPRPVVRRQHEPVWCVRARRQRRAVEMGAVDAVCGN